MAMRYGVKRSFWPGLVEHRAFLLRPHVFFHQVHREIIAETTVYCAGDSAFCVFGGGEEAIETASCR